MDRLVQQCVLQVLEPICEAKFQDHSYGFRPNRSQQHAISQVHKNMQLSHLHYVVDIDIKGFFDNVNHGKLLKQLWTLGIRDKSWFLLYLQCWKRKLQRLGFRRKERHRVVSFLRFCPTSCWMSWIGGWQANGRTFQHNIRSSKRLTATVVPIMVISTHPCAEADWKK